MLCRRKIKDFLKKIEEKLEKLVVEQSVPYNHLFQAARYSLLNGGKRLRPLLTLSAANVLGGDVEIALLPASAIEMIHTYSMIHDDLPCMDDDNFRRGKPALHKVYNEGHAVLTGDYLLTFPFELISRDQRLTPDQKIELICLLSKAAGGEGMAGGQVMDIQLENEAADLEELRSLHRLKTGALFTAAAEFGAIVAHATVKERLLLRKFGSELGIAFQILDDILDVTACKEKRGSDISSDQKNHKTTYPSLLGLDKAERELENHLNNCRDCLNELDRDTALLEIIISEHFHSS